MPININIYQQLLLVTNRSIQGGRSIKSEEETKQGDSTAMTIYAVYASASKKFAFADDLNGIGTVESHKKWWSLLKEEGKKLVIM